MKHLLTLEQHSKEEYLTDQDLYKIALNVRNTRGYYTIYIGDEDDYGTTYQELMDTAPEREMEWINGLVEVFKIYRDHMNSVNFFETKKIYRYLTLKSEDQLNRKNLGIYWCYDPNIDFTELEDLRGSNIYLIEATTNLSNIDWTQTMFANKWSEAENEITLIDDSEEKIKILKITKQ
jgi:hypothetical protein